ncbi:transposase [Thiorhodospira sibirica]|uniref:transposase n=1 Tax=Thiorhodospira sibirica TaxID=154347 RepID=UPI00022C2309
MHEQEVHLIAVDEKTGIQAIEAIHPSHPMQPGHPEAVAFAYKRHGTQTLIAHFEVATGLIITPSIGDTRTEADFVAHIAATVDTDPHGEWSFVCDPLNRLVKFFPIRAYQ